MKNLCSQKISWPAQMLITIAVKQLLHAVLTELNSFLPPQKAVGKDVVPAYYSYTF